MTKYSKVALIDFGSPYIQLLARQTRAAGVYSEVHPCTTDIKKILAGKPDALILTGGTESVSAHDALPLNPELLRLSLPVLALGYAAQAMADALGGKLAPQNVEYQATPITVLTDDPLWHGLDKNALSFWLGCGDKIAALPPGAKALASAPDLPYAAFALPERKLYALQFCPECDESPLGLALLKNFLFSRADLTMGWSMPAFIERSVAECSVQIGDKNVVLGLSGGVDSSVVAAILHRAVGKRLHCIFVDHGLMRLNEGQAVKTSLLAAMPDLNLHYIEAQKLFLGRLAGVEDPEEKRKIIGRTFIEVFDAEAAKIKNVGFLAQGTIYPDVIESLSPKGKVIKSHHNVGGLPEGMELELVEPLRELFKDEVREVGLALGLPEDLIRRQPFPGPGLAVRVLGEVTDARLNVLRAADAIVREEIKAAGWERKVWQSFAILLPLRTVGVRGHDRSYEQVIALRVVDSRDAMCATWSRLPHELLDKISSRIVHEVQGVNRVVYDISAKPPSTIEWE